MTNLEKLAQYKNQKISKELFDTRSWNDMYHDACYEKMIELGLENTEENYGDAQVVVDKEFGLQFQRNDGSWTEK